MSEGYPQGQEQPWHNQEPEGKGSQTVETTDLNSESVETQNEVTEHRDEPDSDTRWDHDKAETMAAVLKEDSVLKKDSESNHSYSFDDAVERRDKQLDVLDKDYVDEMTEGEKTQLRHAHEDQSKIDQGYDESQLKRHLAETQEKYDKAVAWALEHKQSIIEGGRRELDVTVDQILSPYQELYDMNPAVFAQMPTSEFMGITNEFLEINIKIKENESDSKKIEWWSGQIKDAFEKRGIVNWNIIDALEKEIGMSLEMDDDSYDEMSRKFEAEASDSFDKTPRQIMEGYMRVGEEYTSQFETKKLADEQRKIDFLDEHKPETSNQDQN